MLFFFLCSIDSDSTACVCCAFNEFPIFFNNLGLVISSYYTNYRTLVCVTVRVLASISLLMFSLYSTVRRKFNSCGGGGAKHFCSPSLYRLLSNSFTPSFSRVFCLLSTYNFCIFRGSSPCQFLMWLPMFIQCSILCK